MPHMTAMNSGGLPFGSLRMYKSVSNKKVLLIDDIASSGTTIQMLLRSLNSLSTKEIVVFSLIGNGKMELL